jgi:hypothetical protein
MTKTVEMTVSDIKNQVFRVEGFKISIQGKRRVPVRLNNGKQSRGSLSVAEWIEKSFPDRLDVSISVLFGDDRPVRQINMVKLEGVRTTYPAGVKRIAQDKARAEKEVIVAKNKLKAKSKTMRQVKGEIKSLELQTAQEINKAQIVGQASAALDAIECALKKQNSFHPRIVELYRRASNDGIHDTQELIDRILAAWSFAEKEKDRLAQTVTDLKKTILIKG